MNYTRESIKYILKNFFYVFPFAILPAVFFAISVDEAAIISVIDKLLDKNVGAWTFGELFRAISVLSFGDWQSLIFGIIGIIIIVPCVALMMALVEKHLRFGKRTFNGVWTKLNDNLISTGGYALLLLLIYEIWALLLSAFLFFIARINTLVLAYVLLGITFVVFHFVFLYAIGLIYFWLPCMQITGFRALEALHYSQQLLSSIKWKILFGQLFIILIVEGLLVVCAMFVPSGAVFLVWASVLYVILLMVYCVRMQIAYFDKDHIEREDLKKYYH